MEGDLTMKYKVGDKVTIAPHDGLFKSYAGVTGIITRVNTKSVGGKIGHLVGHGPFVWEESELKPVPSSTVTITFTGDTTTATDGEKTATVNGSEETGAIEAIKKLYHRFPQKGDTYYTVSVYSSRAHVDDYTFDDDEVDGRFRDTGNFYETEAAAQAIADKINAIFADERK